MHYNIPTIPFYFLRHGQTEWNREGRLMGQQDIPLNLHGIKQAEEVAFILKESGVTIDRIVASPLLRAKQTAEIINDSLDVPIHFYTGLKEVHFGEAEGKLKAYENLHTSWINGVTPEAAESWGCFKQRVAHAITQSLEEGRSTLIVAHGGVYSAIMDMLGYPNEDADNCVPYRFFPPLSSGKMWNIQSLIGDTEV